MSAGTDTVHDRIARLELTRAQIFGVALATVLVGALAFGQAPMLHEAAHDFRHATGIACH